eukprot:1146784-Amphidinium_carterae.1
MRPHKISKPKCCDDSDNKGTRSDYKTPYSEDPSNNGAHACVLHRFSPLCCNLLLAIVCFKCYAMGLFRWYHHHHHHHHDIIITIMISSSSSSSSWFRTLHKKTNELSGMYNCRQF